MSRADRNAGSIKPASFNDASHPSRVESLIVCDSPDDVPWEGRPERLTAKHKPSQTSSRTKLEADSPDDFE